MECEMASALCGSGVSKLKCSTAFAQWVQDRTFNNPHRHLPTVASIRATDTGLTVMARLRLKVTPWEPDSGESDRR